MTINSDVIFDRENLKKQLLRWKVAAIVAIVAAVGFVASRNYTIDPTTMVGQPVSKKYIAEITIEDIIVENKRRDNIIENLADDKKVQAVVVQINSPGGTVVGSEKLYRLLRKISAKKPVVAVMGTIAASGGYMTALGADYIIAHNGTMTGSIGVVLDSPEVTELAQKIGVKLNRFKSNDMKAALHPLEEVTPEAKAAIMEMVMDNYEFFLSLFMERRNLDRSQAEKLADGRIYTGRQAVKYGLADQIGSTEEALNWLHKERGIATKYKLEEVSFKKKGNLLEEIFADLAEKAKLALMNNASISGFFAIHKG